jgi:hypothetical protein
MDNYSLVPWDLRKRSSNCFQNNLNLRWSHNYKERNSCADKLANQGHSSTTLVWCDVLPLFLCDEFLLDKLGVPYYQFA